MSMFCLHCTVHIYTLSHIFFSEICKYCLFMCCSDFTQRSISNMCSWGQWGYLHDSMFIYLYDRVPRVEYALFITISTETGEYLNYTSPKNAE